MFEMMEWDSDDDYFDEEEDFVNRNDPLRHDRDGFSPYEKDDFEDLTDEEKIEFIDSLDEFTDDEKLRLVDDIESKQFDAVDVLTLAGMFGESIADEEIERERQAIDKEERLSQDVEYVSMKEALHGKDKKVNKFPVRPFEQWVADVLTGKKTWEDD